MKQALRILLLLLPLLGNAQDRKVLNGKITANIPDLQGITIVNRASDDQTVTQPDGVFKVYAKSGDTLVFTAVQLKTKRIVIEENDFNYLPFIIKMEVTVTQLKEILVNDNHGIDAQRLGIIQKKARKFTPAERRYYTATTGSGLVSVDAIINAINGKTKQRKKEILVEKNQMIQSRLSNMFDESYFTEQFGIPKEYVAGFVVYASENEKVARAIKEKNKTLAVFLLGELATEYKQRIAHEK